MMYSVEVDEVFLFEAKLEAAELDRLYGSKHINGDRWHGRLLEKLVSPYLAVRGPYVDCTKSLSDDFVIGGRPPIDCKCGTIKLPGVAPRSFHIDSDKIHPGRMILCGVWCHETRVMWIPGVVMTHRIMSHYTDYWPGGSTHPQMGLIRNPCGMHEFSLEIVQPFEEFVAFINAGSGPGC